MPVNLFDLVPNILQLPYFVARFYPEKFLFELNFFFLILSKPAVFSSEFRSSVKEWNLANFQYFHKDFYKQVTFFYVYNMIKIIR